MNLHKPTLLANSFLAVIERWSSLRGFDFPITIMYAVYRSQSLLQMNLGALLTASLAHELQLGFSIVQQMLSQQ